MLGVQTLVSASQPRREKSRSVLSLSLCPDRNWVDQTKGSTKGELSGAGEGLQGSEGGRDWGLLGGG